jgi:hypothetical protein
MCILRKPHRTRFRESLHPCCDIHPIAQQIATTNRDIPDMDADAKPKCLLVTHPGTRLSELLLHRDRAFDGINDARKLRQHAIARRVGDPTAELSDEAVHDHAGGSEGA